MRNYVIIVVKGTIIVLNGTTAGADGGPSRRNKKK